MKKTFYVPVLSPVEEEGEEEPSVKFCPKNTKRNRRRYIRHIRKQRKSYFKDAVENKTYDTDKFLDDLHEWYIA